MKTEGGKGKFLESLAFILIFFFLMAFQKITGPEI